MTLLEQYNALPKNVQTLISDYVTYNEYIEDCRETLLQISPGKECSVTALVDAFALWKQEQLNLEEELEKHGISGDIAYSMGILSLQANKEN
mgnify:CR=1 FL=1